MTGHADQCVDRYLELANEDETNLKHITTPSLDEHQIPPEEFEGKGVLEAVAARIVLKLLYLARVGRMDILWSVNALAREVTRWNPACDRRLHRLISYFAQHPQLDHSEPRRGWPRAMHAGSIRGREFRRRIT